MACRMNANLIHCSRLQKVPEVDWQWVCVDKIMSQPVLGGSYCWVRVRVELLSLATRWKAPPSTGPDEWTSGWTGIWAALVKSKGPSWAEPPGAVNVFLGSWHTQQVSDDRLVFHPDIAMLGSIDLWGLVEEVIPFPWSGMLNVCSALFT